MCMYANMYACPCEDCEEASHDAKLTILTKKSFSKLHNFSKISILVSIFPIII